MARQMEQISCKYGAPMGRPSFGALENVDLRTLRLFEVRPDSGGYDDGGAYWGHGGAVWCATDGDGFFQTCRAGTRMRAVADHMDRAR